MHVDPGACFLYLMPLFLIHDLPPGNEPVILQLLHIIKRHY
jgi:hypothetical protein